MLRLMEYLLAFLLGLVIATLVGLVLRGKALTQQAETHSQELEALRAETAQAREAQVKARADVERLEALRQNDQEAAAQREDFLKSQREEMEKTFRALSSRALEDSNKSFLDRAQERLEPMRKQLEKLEKATQEMEEKRSKAYGSLGTQLKDLQEATNQYRTQAQSLSEALRGSSQARGRIGELVLRNIAEFAGMTRHCDFIEQEADVGGQRPDMIVKVPDGGEIPVDAKFPLAAYHRALETTDPAERQKHLAQHAKDLKTHVQEVARRDYAQYTSGDSDFTVLFLPGDHLLSAAFEAAPNLQEEAFDKRVLITTPVTLVALLRTVALYWRQQQLADNAKDIAEASKELMTRLGKFSEHLAKVGRGLKSATSAYNSAVGSYESRIRPQGERVYELQHNEAKLTQLDHVADDVRQLAESGEA